MSNSRNKNKKIENITSERHRAIEQMVEKRLKLRLIEAMQWGFEVLELLQWGLRSVKRMFEVLEREQNLLGARDQDYRSL